MKKDIFMIKENRMLAADICRMILEGDTSRITAPGQFVNIRLDGLFLRRPISVCDWDERTITLIYKVVGKGTEQLAAMEPGSILDILTGLGNGYDLSQIGEHAVLVGGGVGVPPLYGLAKALISKGSRPEVILGFNGKEDVFYEAEFRSLGLPVTVTTVDGSYGRKGFVTAAMKPEYDYACACGPEPMLRSVWEMVSDGQFSFESRMACGFGGCMGCSCETRYGSKRICKEGPVLRKEEIIWQR